MERPIIWILDEGDVTSGSFVPKQISQIGLVGRFDQFRFVESM
jgi:hypothetical protein